MGDVTATDIQAAVSPRANRMFVGEVFAVIGCVSSILIAALSLRLIFIWCHELGGWCGTVLAMAQTGLWGVIPLMLILPLLSLMICDYCNRGRWLAKWSFLLALSTWLGICIGQMLGITVAAWLL
jgi:hypothetical protein